MSEAHSLAMVQAPRSTDLEARVVDRLPRFKLRGSRLLDGELGVTGAGCWIWIELAGAVGRMLLGLAAWTAGA